MRNVHRELNKTSEEYVFNSGCPPAMYKDLTAFVLSRLEQILAGSDGFESEEAWLIRTDIASLLGTVHSVTGAYPSQVKLSGGTVVSTGNRMS